MNNYLMTDGAAETYVRTLDRQQSERFVLQLFNTLVLLDNVEPKAAHTALLNIWEYATSINGETPGALPTDSYPT